LATASGILALPAIHLRMVRSSIPRKRAVPRWERPSWLRAR
jgi:hypothetical protein